MVHFWDAHTRTVVLAPYSSCGVQRVRGTKGIVFERYEIKHEVRSLFPARRVRSTIVQGYEFKHGNGHFYQNGAQRVPSMKSTKVRMGIPGIPWFPYNDKPVSDDGEEDVPS